MKTTMEHINTCIVFGVFVINMYTV